MRFTGCEKMRRRPLILVSFLLMLYIGPMIFTWSYGNTAIPAEPNMNKDFSTSAYGDPSPQSITSFSETLPDDVLFYPDGDFADPLELANVGEDSGFGTGDYTDTQAVDSTNYYVYTSTSEDIYEILNFTTPSDVNLGQIDINVYACVHGDDSSVATRDLLVYDFTAESYVDKGDLTEDNSVPYDDGHAWLNITITSGAYDYGIDSNVMIKFDVKDDSNTIQLYVDYAEVVFYYPHLNDAGHYAESFCDISDWSLDAGIAPTTDYDVMSWAHPGDSAFDYIYTNSPAVTGNNYLEIRYRENVTATNSLTIDVYTADDKGGTSKALVTLNPTTTWQTWKGIVGQDVESIRLGHDSSAACEVQLDYLRDGDETSFGFQHDGSTVSGFRNESNDGWTFGYSTDGDNITITYSRSGGTAGYGSVWLDFDTTATKADLETSYYPFMAINWSCSAFTASNVRAYWYVDGKTQGSMTEYIGGQAFYSTFAYREDRQNIAALTGSAGANIGVRFLCYGSDGQGATIKIDYIKAYSIANFSYSGSSVTIDDFLYVDSSILFSNIDSGYIEANHDPALSVEVPPYASWNMNTSLGTPQVDFYNGAWLGYSNETTGEFSPYTTFTDFRFKFTASANIISLTFIDLVRWNVNGVATFLFSVLFDMWGMDTALIILGLVMIPVSTIYLAYGIKHDRSSNRLFYGLIIFMVGCGLLIGGILP